MNLTDQKIKDILLAEHYVSEEDGVKMQKYLDEKSGPLWNFLSAEKIINKDVLGQALAEHFKLEYADLNSFNPVREQVLKIPEEVAKKYTAVLFKEENKSVTVATADPENKSLMLKLKEIFPHHKVFLAYSLPEDIEESFVFYQKALSTRFSEILKNEQRFAPAILEAIISDAVAFRASDIHFEPAEKEVLVRFRLDGTLQEAGRLDKTYFENLLNRIKVQGGLRIDEHASAQDGAIRFELPDQKLVDLRVSILPTLNGEKVVMRLLSEYVRSFQLTEIGLSTENQNTIKEAIAKPFGMILVTGPTGSGKTTTLYTVLKLLNKPDINITTIEDPVEYRVLGVNQIQVNKNTNLTFAQGLRSIVRQDPDIILVGEIRDRETAEIAVNAALTGHLLLSSFHANDAATSIPRLLDMGVEPFLLSSTLNIIVAQRLVRRLCEQCRHSLSATEISHLKKYQSLAADLAGATIYTSKGCRACNQTGYKGRIAIFEIIKNTPELQDLILKNPAAKEIWQLAQQQGAQTLFADGLEKVRAGITSLDEVLRVAPPV
jgi:type IV pilus assembly protein PilB